MKIGLVVGCADCVWDDVAAAYAAVRAAGQEFSTICCVKLAGVHWKDRFDLWATLHPEYMDDYEAQRRERGFPNGYQIVAPFPQEVGAHGAKGRIAKRVSYRWPKMNSSASSGIYGAKVALEICDRVVLAGIPLTSTPHFSRGKVWRETGSFLPGFAVALPHMLGRVKSMSGLTKEKLGGPDPEWLAGG